MEETSAISLELVVVALIALAVLLGFVWYNTNSRLKSITEQINQLQKNNEELKRLLTEREKKIESLTTIETKKTDMKAFYQEEREKTSETNDSLAEDLSSKISDEISTDVIAVIMAAISACGHDPATIRSIRPIQHKKSKWWIMSGRLASMR